VDPLKVFKIKFDSTTFQGFTPVDDTIYRHGGQLDFDGRSKANVWQPLDVYVLHPLRDIPDIWQLSAGSGEFIVNESVAIMLRWSLRTAGELLPVRHGVERFFLCNVTEVVNCLDHAKTVFRRTTPDGIGIGPLKYAFHHNRFTTSLFKIPEQVKSSLFVLERSGDPEKEFKAAVEHNALRGVTFELIWESTDDRR
jgi:hypothetical protein